ncbi:MAG: hypothetical protein AAF988_06470 [Pseudomonadota bacterium]
MSDQTKVMDASQFAMWRAVLAMVHADGIVTPHEVSFVNDQIKDLDFSEDQLAQLSEDFKTPQDVKVMFAEIKNQNHKKQFFMLARALSWCDGDLDDQEAHIIEVLEKQMLAEEDRALLNQTREEIQEIELCDGQWVVKNGAHNQNQSMLGFLKQLVSA